MFTDIFALPDDCFAPVAPPSPIVEPPVDPDIILADATADPEDLIFQGINLTKTTERMWAKPVTDLPDWIRPLYPETDEPVATAASSAPEVEHAVPAAAQKTTATAATSAPEPSSTATSPVASRRELSVEVIDVNALHSGLPGQNAPASISAPPKCFSWSIPPPQHIHPMHALQLSAYNMALYQQMLSHPMAAPQLAYAARAHSQMLFPQFHPRSAVDTKTWGRVATPPAAQKRAAPYTKRVKDWKEIPAPKSTSSTKKQRTPKKQRQPCPPHPWPATMPFPTEPPEAYDARMRAIGYNRVTVV